MKLTNLQDALGYKMRMHDKKEFTDYISCDHNLGKDNFVVKATSYINQLRSRISSAGVFSREPYVEENGNRVFWKENDIAQATDYDFHCHQVPAMVAYYRLMKKRLLGKKIQPVATYPVHYGESTEFHDGNYVAVQPKLTEDYVCLRLPVNRRVDKLKLSALITKERLEDLADAVEAGAWHLTWDNLWLHKPDNTFWITDLKKPSDEGYGPNAASKTAVLNNGNGTEQDRALQWDLNRLSGYCSVREYILSWLDNRDEMQQQWDCITEKRMGIQNWEEFKKQMPRNETGSFDLEKITEQDWNTLCKKIMK